MGEKLADKPTERTSTTPTPVPVDRRTNLITPPPASPVPGQLVPTYNPAPNEFGSSFRLIPKSDQILELQTIIRDK